MPADTPVRMLVLKSRREMKKMAEAGRLVAQAHAIAREMCQPGVKTSEIDAQIDKLFAEHRATPLFKGFPGEVPFPAATCISINEVVVHGIPGDQVLRAGDIVSVDTGCRVDGWCGDAAWTYPVGEVDDEKQRLLECGRNTLATAIKGFGTEKKWSQVARRMMAEVKRYKFALVEQFVGHGIGKEMHEGPQVPNYTSDELQDEDFDLRPGIVLAIEPMINVGTHEIEILSDTWTAVTADRRPSVHFEHTVGLTSDGPLILTDGVGDPLFP
ncbi:MAG: type I methionyl aminopeptidase [Planctomycetaceae bacterium]